jgi:HD domain
VTALEERAQAWIEPYWNAEHLRRTRDWLLELDPAAAEASRLAALVHDIERHFPGGPVQDLVAWPEDEQDAEYQRLHSERSARIVADWLRGQGADEPLVEEVERLVAAHETGGGADEDLIQAADSLSFLEVNPSVLVGWYAKGRCSRERAKAQARWMFERIRLPRARELAEPLYEEAIATVDRA